MNIPPRDLTALCTHRKRLLPETISQLPPSQYEHKSPKRVIDKPGSEQYSQLALELLDNLYPKKCPKCGIKLTKTISTRTHVIRCEKCRYQGSRLKGTPLQNFKLPLWVFGWALQESRERYPKVITATEIERRIGVAKNTATLIKRRLQLLAAEQLPKLTELMKEEMKEKLGDVKFPREDNKDLTEIVKGKSIPQADTCALYSTSQRANKGRKRYKNTGLTASIYMSDKLGGEQKGILVKTITWKKGPVLYQSVPDNTAATLRPILDATIPKDIPIYTDEGYKFYYRINKNHRMINHSLKSKDKRYRFSRERWSKNGINTQCVEGHNRNLKHNFGSAYGYIKPKWSQLYLDEYAFFRNVKYYGWDALLPVSSAASAGDGEVGNCTSQKPAGIRRERSESSSDVFFVRDNFSAIPPAQHPQTTI